MQIPAGEAEGRRRGPRQHLDDPVVEAVAVAKEADEVAEVAACGQRGRPSPDRARAVLAQPSVGFAGDRPAVSQEEEDKPEKKKRINEK